MASETMIMHVSTERRRMRASYGLLWLVSAGLAGPADAQQAASKPAVEYAAYDEWNTSIQLASAVSPNGMYVAYSYRVGAATTLVVESTNGKFKQELSGFRAGFAQPTFTADNRRFVFTTLDSVIMLDLRTRQRTSLLRGAVSPSGRWLAGGGDTLALTDLESGRVRRYALSGRPAFVATEAALVVSGPDSVVWIALATGKATTVHRGPRASDVVLDATGTRLAFTMEDSTGVVVRVYRIGMDSARVGVGAGSRGLPPTVKISADAPWFGPDGSQLYFRVTETASAPPSDSLLIAKTVDVWHYRDYFLQSQQLVDLRYLEGASYTAVTATAGGPVIVLENRDTVLAGPPGNRHVLVKRVVNIGEETGTTFGGKGVSYALISLLDGLRTPLAEFDGLLLAKLSPDERFVVAFDPMVQRYRAYEVATGITRTIAKDIAVPLGRATDDSRVLLTQRFSYGLDGWVAGGLAVLVNDQYDLWQVDPRGIAPSINLTAGYGRRHNITLRLSVKDGLVRAKERVLLRALDEATENQGYGTARIGRSAAPAMGTLGPWAFGPGLTGGYLVPGLTRAEHESVYLVPRQTERDAPNWFVTTDLKSFRRLTNVQPHERYNWFTSELLSWTAPDGQRLKGVLYKPENFDPAKKYPVIVYYYERLSHELHLYRKPAYSSGPLNMPWYVSHGYLVFMPDITYRLGHPAASVVNAVMSGVDRLAPFPWVDTTKMGIQGQSFGGYETLVLASRTHRFAAANAAAGISDLVRMYGATAYGEHDNTWQVEVGQSRMGTTPWARPDLFVENSPIFRADSVTTPLLLMHNKGDGNVEFGQSVEMFIALRRLQKPVWLLQYDDEGHTVNSEIGKRDFTIRQQQFFDHYLKGAPAPVWMTRGVPATGKGVVSGLELDRSGQKP